MGRPLKRGSVTDYAALERSSVHFTEALVNADTIGELLEVFSHHPEHCGPC